MTRLTDHFEQDPDTGRMLPPAETMQDVSEYGAQTKYAVTRAMLILLPVMVFVAWNAS